MRLVIPVSMVKKFSLKYELAVTKTRELILREAARIIMKKRSHASKEVRQSNRKSYRPFSALLVARLLFVDCA